VHQKTTVADKPVGKAIGERQWGTTGGSKKGLRKCWKSLWHRRPTLQVAF